MHGCIFTSDSWLYFYSDADNINASDVCRQTIEMIEKEQREVERRPITKITHKGEIEIENQEPAKAPEAIEAEVRFVTLLFIHLCNIHQDLALLFYSFLCVHSPSRCRKQQKCLRKNPRRQ